MLGLWYEGKKREVQDEFQRAATLVREGEKADKLGIRLEPEMPSEERLLELAREAEREAGIGAAS